VTPFDEYIKKHRGIQGVMSIVTDDRNGQVVAVKSVSPTDELIITSSEGIVIRIRVGEGLREQGRNTKGVRIMKLADNDKVVSVAAVKQPEGSEAEGESGIEISANEEIISEDDSGQDSVFENSEFEAEE